METGEGTRRGFTGNWYFWADCRPTYEYAEHWQYQPSGSDVGKAMEYDIDKGSSGQFAVAATNTTTGALLFNGLSTANTMSANEIEIGLETTNNSYSVTHADPDYFTYNQYHGTNGVWNYQTNPKTPYMNGGASPTFVWTVPPAPGNNGGQGKTTCC